MNVKNIVLEVFWERFFIKFQGDKNVCEALSFHHNIFHVRFRNMLESFRNIKGYSDTYADCLSYCWRSIC